MSRNQNICRRRRQLGMSQQAVGGDTLDPQLYAPNRTGKVVPPLETLPNQPSGWSSSESALDTIG